MKLSYRVCIYPNSMNDGFTAIVSDLPGCVTCGDTIQEVFEMAVDAASGWVLTELEDGNAPPRSSEIATIRPDEYPDGFTSMLILDMDAYAEKYGEKAVRKKTARFPHGFTHKRNHSASIFHRRCRKHSCRNCTLNKFPSSAHKLAVFF